MERDNATCKDIFIIMQGGYLVLPGKYFSVLSPREIRLTQPPPVGFKFDGTLVLGDKVIRF